MKVRESGMPPEEYWRTFFDSPRVLEQLGLETDVRDVAEFGCGYGTFTVAAARVVRGLVHAIDIEPDMISATMRNVAAAGLCNVRFYCRDFTQEGSGLADASCGYVMLFNILHAEEPLRLLGEARRVLAPGGRLAVLHWNYDASTPRGPSLTIRPRPEQCLGWIAQAGFHPISPEVRRVGPYHYGIVAVRSGTP